MKNIGRGFAWFVVVLSWTLVVNLPILQAADLEGSKDPEGLKRFAGSSIVAYRAPQFDEFILPLGKMLDFSPVRFEKSKTLEGMISRYTYGAPANASPYELFQNYKNEFRRLGVTTLYEAGPGLRLFCLTLQEVGAQDGLRNLFQVSSLSKQDRLLIGKSTALPSVYYYVYVGTKDSSALGKRLADDQAFAQVIVIAPKAMEDKMVFSAAEMKESLDQSGKVLLYGVYFDTDKDALRPDAGPALQEIAKLLNTQPSLKLRVVGHTDNQGTPAHNLDLSKRRVETLVRELTSKHGIAAQRLDAFGCGLYAPVAKNTTEEERAKNRRVELLAFE